MCKHLPAFCKAMPAFLLLITIKATAQPTVSSYTPASGPVGTSVIITGTNFNAVPANNIVFFGAVKATVTAGTANSLSVTVPAGATYQPISVLNNATALTGYSAKPYLTTFANPFGNGVSAGFYKPKVDFVTGNTPRNIVTGDVDGDGKPDLIISNGNSNTISILHNTSTAGSINASSFEAKVDFASGNFTENVSIGDVDGDGKPDLVVVTNANISVLRNTSVSGTINASSFAAKIDFTSNFSGPVFGTISDVDGDGKPDIITANLGGSAASVRRNTSTPGVISFAARVDFPAGGTPYSIAVGDVDGDGKPDLAVANAGAGINTISVLRNTSTSGSISFAAKVDFTTGATPRSVALGDVDGDGKPDLVVANNAAAAPVSTTISVLRNTSTAGSINAGSFAAKVDFTAGASPRYVAIGDVDGDGKPDVAVANMNSANISVLRNTSAAGIIDASAFAAKVDFATDINPVSAVIVDVDGDGIPEVATANGSGSSVSLFQIDLSALPVLFTNVKASQLNAGVQVQWTIQQQNNIERYEVERSQNGQQYAKLASVEARGNSNAVINYNLFDPNPFDGINYYRIKIIEAGQVSYSRILKINISNGVVNMITIYPNPITGNSIALQMNLQKGSYLIRLTNNIGQQLITKVIAHAGGSATENIEPSKALAAGVYQLNLSGEGINITRQIIKK